MNWRTKIVVAAWLVMAIAIPIFVRNLMLGGWKDLPIASLALLSVLLILVSSSYFLLKGARRNSK